MARFTFTKMEQNYLDDYLPTHSDALYDYGLKADQSKWTFEASIPYYQVQILMRRFNVQEPRQLISKSFESEQDDKASVLTDFILKASEVISNRPSDHEELRRRAAQALAAMQVPDYDDVRASDVCDAFLKVFHNPTWIEDFKALVYELSEREVQLAEANYEDFMIRYSGPAMYLELIHGEIRQKVIFGPYSTPFVFPDKVYKIQ